MLETCTIISFSNEIKDVCIKLKQQYGIKTPHAIIAATAIVENIPFVSNDDDFKKIKQLDFVKV